MQLGPDQQLTPDASCLDQGHPLNIDERILGPRLDPHGADELVGGRRLPEEAHIDGEFSRVWLESRVGGEKSPVRGATGKEREEQQGGSHVANRPRRTKT